MGLLDSVGGLGGLLQRATSGNASEAEVHSAYDQVSQSAPPGALADALTHTFNSDQTPPFEQMVSGMFAKSNPDQKAGLLNQLLGSLGPGALASVIGGAGSGGLGSLAGTLSGGGVTPAQAQQVSPQDVQVLAQQAASKDSSIVSSVAGFYAQHSTLVKAIGAGALAMMMSHLSRR